MDKHKYTTPQIPEELKNPQTDREKVYLNLLLDFADRVKKDYMTGFIQREEFESQKKDQGVYIFLDGDGLKKINDVTGSHQAGHAAIHALANGINKAIRTRDQNYTVSRTGGDEFVIFIQGVDLEVGKRIANRILESIRQQKIEYKGNAQEVKEILDDWPLTASIGVGLTEEQADQAMYKAKSNGRDRVEVYVENKAAKVLYKIRKAKLVIKKIAGPYLESAMVYRIQNEKGEGPFWRYGTNWQNSNDYSLFQKIEESKTKDKQIPSIDDDTGFTANEQKTNQNNENYFFVFLNKDDYKKWYTPKQIELLEKNGFKLISTYAKDITYSTDTNQAFVKSLGKTNE